MSPFYTACRFVSLYASTVGAVWRKVNQESGKDGPCSVSESAKNPNKKVLVPVFRSEA